MEKSIYFNTGDSVSQKKEAIRRSVKEWFNVKTVDDRLLKYYEILLFGENASPYSDIDTMDFRRLGIALTAKCNAHCFACYRFDSHYKSILDYEMPWEKLVAFVRNTKGKFRMIHAAGLGEVWMYPKLFEAISLMRKLSENIKVTTNSSFLNKKNIHSIIDSGLTHMEVSIWQFDQKKEKKYRGLDLKKSIDDVIYLCNDTLLDVQVNVLVASYNYEDLFNLVEYLKPAKKLKIHTIPLFETETALRQKVQRVSTREHTKLLLHIKSQIDKYKLNWEMKPEPNENECEPVIEMKKNQNICFTAFEDPYISETGHLLPCVRMKPMYSSGIPIPKVDASIGFEKVWHHPAMLEFRQNMLTGHYPQLCGQLCYVKKQEIQPDVNYLNQKWGESIKLRSEQPNFIED